MINLNSRTYYYARVSTSEQNLDRQIDEFKSLLTNSSFSSFRRIGKYLLLDLNNNYTIISHLRMEGKYIKRKKMSL